MIFKMVLKSIILIFGFFFFFGSSSSYVIKNGTVYPKEYIFGGTAWPIEYAAHHVQLITISQDIFGRTDQQFICGGSLITYEIVLTAAHCAKTVELAGNVEVYAGSASLYGYEEKRSGVNIYFHPGFVTEYLYHNDIAMIKVNKPFSNPKIIPIRITLVPTQASEWVRLHGFGIYDENQQTSPFLRQLTSQTVYCPMQPDICIKNSVGHGACYGDSGSGLVNTKLEIIGVVSRGSRPNECATGALDLYTSVYAHLKFIYTGLQRLSPDDKLARKILKAISNVFRKQINYLF